MIIDPSGRGPSHRTLGLAGTAMLAVIAAVVALLGLRYTGAFDDRVAVVAMLTSSGDGLPERADVKFRGMLVGSVAGVDIVAKGERQRVEIDLLPEAAGDIPGTVTARVVPANIFGVTAVELVDNGPAARGLRAGMTIEQDTSRATTELQTTLTTLRTVLDHIQPEKLGRVLGTLADALDPAARVPGSTIERLDTWTTQVRAIPEIGDLLGDLGAATTAISASAPELIDVLAASVTSARTITERRAGVLALLTGASSTIDATNALFARNPDAGKELVAGLDETFGALAADPDALPVSVANLNAALGELATVFNWGPSKQMSWAIDVTFTPFQQYTAQDCPRYGDVAGPRCSDGSVPNTAPAQRFPPTLIPRHLDSAGPAPVVPGAFGLPGAPGAPGAPGTTGVPATPLAPGLPGFPLIPGLPPLPFLVPGGPIPPAPATSPESAPPAPAGPGTPRSALPGSSSPDSSPAAHPDRTAVPGSRRAGAGAAEAGQSASARPLRGRAAVAALVGGEPNAAQLLLLGPVLAGGSLTVRDTTGVQDGGR
ncbi:MlaD family protein [Nocardia cyriacigeorgica]|uniref:MlaD family protein n=1 Tax=Nocardia cyriacigeorgica TaxID=135487 RepID=UPI001894F805|nr:MCE family protein [Nocardia cyriacigeorgica]MBF6456157.1 MCE family protein [Nocardia cyriacigeorgica]MBF6477041.1 MCE family protein [Nocardia cyriacigeorgica]MBF6553103.1 MCE family protein [Nocardia cyriacigeorgica]